VYDELHRLAAHYLPQRGGNTTLQPTALLHDAYIRLVDVKTVDLHSQTHFRAIAAVAMRQALIDHVRRGKRAKRGGDWRKITLSGVQPVAKSEGVDLLALNEALGKFAELDERAAKVVEMRFFGGLTETEVAEVLGVSERTVRNDWSMARTWRDFGSRGIPRAEKAVSRGAGS
jgi:RNA polymerase sigma factor (TIGR02999 family)